MNLSGRLAMGMMFPVAALLLALGFIHGVTWPGILLAGGAVAVVLMTAEVIARSLSRTPAQLVRAAEALSRGQQVTLGSSDDGETAQLAATLAELSAQLGSRQHLLEKTVESIRDPVVVADEHGMIVIVNAAARRLYSVEPGFDTLTGVRTFQNYYADGTTVMPIPDTPMARALRGDNVDDFELIVKPQPPQPAVFLVVNARPLRDDTGNLRGAVAVLHDVTAQRRAHQALVESEQMAQAIVRTALDAFVQTDQDGFILDWSPQAEALTGELARVRGELETQLALSSKAGGGALQVKKAAEGATAELRQSLKKERDTAEVPAPGHKPTLMQAAEAAATEQPTIAEAQGDPEVARLLARASALLVQGDIGAARIVLEHAVGTGSARASFMLAETYDPLVLSTWKTYGTRGDVTKARELYAKALAGGIQQARDRSVALQ